MVPGYSKTKGGEEADSEAYAALKLFQTREVSPEYINLAYTRRIMHQKQQELFNELRSTACPPLYQDLEPQMRRRKSSDLVLSRRLLHGLLAARSGHRNFAKFHLRFHHENANHTCVFGQKLLSSTLYDVEDFIPKCVSLEKAQV